MELKTLSITNFAGIGKMEISPKKINVLFGENGHGKTSVLKALEFVLAGKSDRTSLLKYDSAKGGVVVKIQNAGSTWEIAKVNEENKPLKVYLNRKLTSQKSLNAFLQRELGASKDVISMMTNSSIFETATSSELTEFLLNSGFIPMTLSLNRFIEICKDEPGGISAETERRLRKTVGDPTEMLELSFFEKLNSGYKDWLKYQKREFTRLNSIASSYVGAVPTAKIEDIDRELERIISEEATALAVKGTLKKIETTKAEIKRLRSLYDADKSTKPNPADLAKWQKTLKDTQDKIEKATAAKSAFETNNQVLRKQLKNLDTSKCPLSERIICTQDKSAAKQEIEELIENNEVQISLFSEDLRIYKEDYTLYSAKIAEYTKAEKAYLAKLNLLKRINALEEALPKVTATAVSSTTDYTAKKNNLRTLKEQVLKYQQAKEAEKKIAELRREKNEIEILERLTSKQGSVNAKILESLLSVLIVGANDIASKICPELKLNLNINSRGNVAICCTTPTGYQDYKDISAGEKLLVQFLIMSQINQLSGFKLIALDNIDRLDKAHFENLIDFRNKTETADLYDHVFLGTVNHTDFEEVLDKHKECEVIRV